MSVVPFPQRRTKNRACKAEIGDLVVGSLITQAGVFAVMRVAAVDADGAVMGLTDMDGALVAIGRIFDVRQAYFICAADLITAAGHRELHGMFSAEVEDIKAAFRDHFAGRST